MKSIRVVAADDSAVMRSLLSLMFAGAAGASGTLPRLELCAAVSDGEACLQAVRTMRPDIVLMDLHMPGMGGLETVDLLRRERPDLPIIMCSTYTADGAAATLEALSRGASDYVTKPVARNDSGAAMASLWTQLAPKIYVLTGKTRMEASQPAMRSQRCAERPMLQVGAVAIGVSTGGPAALERLLPRLPKDFPAPVLLVQHMPKLFTAALAERLDRCCALRVRLATAGTMLQPGTIWLAPGDSHMIVKAGVYGKAQLGLHRGAPVHHCRPAVDVLFRSVAETFRARSLGVILTGMGSDGLEGSRAIVRAGGTVLAQDEASAAVWGMPGRIADAGLAQAVLPLEELADELVALTSQMSTPSLVRPAVATFETGAMRGAI
jgi:two-component system chemotaxis response regulator CheB